MTDYNVLFDARKNVAERFETVIRLAGEYNRASLDLLAQGLLHDPSPIVRHECAFHLGKRLKYGKDIAPYLQQAIASDTSLFVQHEALIALGEVGDLSYVPFIQSFLTNDYLEIRESAEIALATLQRRYQIWNLKS